MTAQVALAVACLDLALWVGVVLLSLAALRKLSNHPTVGMVRAMFAPPAAQEAGPTAAGPADLPRLPDPGGGYEWDETNSWALPVPPDPPDRPAA